MKSLIVFLLILGLLTLYSYTLVDPNLTLINHPFWTQFRNTMVEWGYYRRDLTAIWYTILICALYLTHLMLVRNPAAPQPLHVAVLIGTITFIAYPILSHDLFNYLFDAKILTVYGKSPYLFRALDFPADSWTRFMHWTHRTYPYGPTFLPITLIPVGLSFGKFFPAFLLYKLMMVVWYILAVYILQKHQNNWALFFATHPLIIIEGLINGHNDLIAVSIALLGWHLLTARRQLLGRIILFISAGIKYTTAPLLLITAKKGGLFTIAALGTLTILGYLTFTAEIQPWYFMILFPLIPAYFIQIKNWSVFFLGLLLSYFPYIRYGEWGTTDTVPMKHMIIAVFFGINLVTFSVIRILTKLQNTHQRSLSERMEKN